MKTEDVIENLDEGGRWHGRPVTYWGGSWVRLRDQIPRFQISDFRACDDGPANPYMKSVVRLPRTHFEKEVPVGTVSSSYTLAQHVDVAEHCLKGVRDAGVSTHELRCEVGLTELGEWMNFRIYFPDSYSHTPKDKQRMGLRLECFNSVEASSSLVILLGWFRFVCSNGLIMGETRTDVRDIHNKSMELETIPGIVCDTLKCVQKEREQLSLWESLPVDERNLGQWINKLLSHQWGKKAACRVYHICQSGYDIEITDPFFPGEATEKPVKRVTKVLGSPEKAKNMYDVSLALSWVATKRSDSEERIEWQSSIPDLIARFAVIA